MERQNDFKKKKKKTEKILARERFGGGEGG